MTHDTHWRSLSQYIVSQRLRIRELAMNDFSLLSSTLRSIEKVPILETLRFPASNENQTLLGLSSRLNQFAQLPVSQTSRKRFFNASLWKEFGTWPLSICLSSMRYLEAVEIYGDLANFRQITGAEQFSWRYLRLSGIIFDLGLPVFKMITPTLVSLDVRIIWSTVPKLLSLWNKMPCLESLYLKIYVSIAIHQLSISQGGSGDDFEPLDPPPLSYFHLSLMVGQNTSGKEADIVNFFANIAGITPRIRYLRFNGSMAVSQSFFSYASEHQFLRRVIVDIDDSEAKFKELGESNVATLKTEHLKITVNIPFHLIMTLGVINLEINGPEEHLADVPQVLMSSQWNNLYTLLISDTAIRWSNVSLLCVTIIIFTRFHYMDNAVDFTYLCHEIATNPRGLFLFLLWVI